MGALFEQGRIEHSLACPPPSPTGISYPSDYAALPRRSGRAGYLQLSRHLEHAFLGGSPFFIFLLRQFFLTLPLELDEAAKLDGCGPFRILWQILLPLAVPGLTTVAIFSFLWNWNEFLWPLIVLNDVDKWTIPLGLNGFRDQYGTDWNHLMAASFVASLPVIIIFFIFQSYFIQGIATTGAKG